MYADDTQLYIALKPGAVEESIKQLEAYIIEVKVWMQAKFLKLNKDKTEFMIFGTKNSLNKIGNTEIKIANHDVSLSKSVRNLGMLYDRLLKLDDHIRSIKRSACMQLYNTGHIHKYLAMEETKTIVHAFIISRLDYANSLLYGLPKGTIRQLQKSPNQN